MVMSTNIASLFEHAASQWGLITSAQALRIGVSRTQLNRMASDGRLELVSYGVYRATMGDETSHAAIKAAWLSLYPKRFAYERLHDSPNDAVVTGRTAVCMYGYGDLYESPYCFIVQKGKRSTRKDIELIHAPIDEQDVSREFGIPVATPERAVADLVRLHEDPSLIDDVMADAAREGHIFDKERLSELLSPLAKDNGYEAKDGDSFASELIDRNATGIVTESLADKMARAIAASRHLERVRQALAEATLQGHATKSIREYAGCLDLSAICQASTTLNSLQPFFKTTELLSQLVQPCAENLHRAIDGKQSGKQEKEGK